MVIQTGPKHSWIASTFGRAAARPHAYTMAQEIFQAKVIPGWTDFETYIEFSDHEIAGLDMVFIKNGYVYHTAQDDLAHVTAGTLQHVGNNLLPTVRAMANSPYLVDSLAFRDRSAVFFDVWGLFLIVISDADMARGFYLCFAALVLLLDFRDAAASNSSYRSWIASIARASHSKLLCSSAGSLPLSLLGFCLQCSLRIPWHGTPISTYLFAFQGVLFSGCIELTAALHWHSSARAQAEDRQGYCVIDQLPTCSFGSQADHAALLFHTVIMLLFALRVFSLPMFLLCRHPDCLWKRRTIAAYL